MANFQGLQTASMLPDVVANWDTIPLYAKVLAIGALPIAWVCAEIWDSYHSWRKLGPGGLPHNPLGYLVNMFLTLIWAKKDTRSLKVYEKPEKFAVGWEDASKEEREKAKKSYLGKPIPRRTGPSSKAKHYCAPQREHNVPYRVNDDVKMTYLEGLDKLSDKHNNALEWSRSKLEGLGQAIFLKENYAVPTLIARCKREVEHIHSSDLSAHVLLSLPDAKSVIDKGWGERHRLTGTSFIPLGYTFLYSPRNREEAEVMLRIMEAGIEYAKSNGMTKKGR